MFRCIFSFLLAACTISPEKTDSTSLGGNCANSAECDEGQLCLENACEDVDCLTSNDCDLDQYCDVGYDCVAGCQSDDDCYAGQNCNTSSGQCEEYGCRDTVLDCDIGEYCNTLTGECYPDSQRHCQSCNQDEFYNGVSDGLCLLFEEKGSCSIDIFLSATGCSSGDVCFPDDVDQFLAAQSMFDFTPQPGTCFESMKTNYCSSGEESCPRGFSCVELTYTDGSSSDAVCYGDCSYYIDNGYY
jgi:hypothetical protein